MHATNHQRGVSINQNTLYWSACCSCWRSCSGNLTCWGAKLMTRFSCEEAWIHFWRWGSQWFPLRTLRRVKWKETACLFSGRGSKHIRAESSGAVWRAESEGWEGDPESEGGESQSDRDQTEATASKARDVRVCRHAAGSVQTSQGNGCYPYGKTQNQTGSFKKKNSSNRQQSFRLSLETLFFFKLRL